MRAKPGQRDGDRLVEQHSAVYHGERRHQVRDDRELATAVQSKHAEEQELTAKVGMRIRPKSCERSRPGQLTRRVNDREWRESDRRGEHRPGGEHRAWDVAHLQLAVDAPACVRATRGRPRVPAITHHPPAVSEPGECRNADEAERDARDVRSGPTLVRRNRASGR